MGKDEKLRILVKEPGKKPLMTWIPKDPDKYEEVVGGHVELMRFGDILCICDEQGKAWGKKKCCKIGDLTLAGTVFFCSLINGKIASLNMSEEDVKKKLPSLWE